MRRAVQPTDSSSNLPALPRSSAHRVSREKPGLQTAGAKVASAAGTATSTCSITTTTILALFRSMLAASAGQIGVCSMKPAAFSLLSSRSQGRKKVRRLALPPNFAGCQEEMCRIQLQVCITSSMVVHGAAGATSRSENILVNAKLSRLFWLGPKKSEEKT